MVWLFYSFTSFRITRLEPRCHGIGLRLPRPFSRCEAKVSVCVFRYAQHALVVLHEARGSAPMCCQACCWNGGAILRRVFPDPTVYFDPERADRKTNRTSPTACNLPTKQTPQITICFCVAKGHSPFWRYGKHLRCAIQLSSQLH